MKKNASNENIGSMTENEHLCTPPISQALTKPLSKDDMPGKNGYGAIFTCPKCGHMSAKTGLHCVICGYQMFEK